MKFLTAIKREILKYHERFQHVAAGLQSYAIILGVLVGACWAVYTFISLRERDTARAQLHQYQIQEHEFELRKSEFERVGREQAVANVEVKAAQVATPTDAGRAIEINIQLKNIGNRNVKFEFPDYSMTVAKVQPDDKGYLHIDRDKIKNPTIPYINARKLPSRDLKSDDRIYQTPPELLRAGQTMTYLSWCRVEEPGLYLIEFAARLTGQDLTATRLGLNVTDENEPFHVVGQTFIVVK